MSRQMYYTTVLSAQRDAAGARVPHFPVVKGLGWREGGGSVVVSSSVKSTSYDRRHAGQLPLGVTDE